MRSWRGILPQLSGSQVLLVTAGSNGVFCVSQGVASQLSHSLALLGDSIDMAADTVTYTLAFWIEHRKETGAGQLPLRFAVGELLVALLSGLSLVAGALAIIRESVRRHAGGEEEEQDVNQVVIFGFAGVNLVVNSLQLSLFLSRQCDGWPDVRAEPSGSCCSPLSPLDATFFPPEGCGGGQASVQGGCESADTNAAAAASAAEEPLSRQPHGVDADGGSSGAAAVQRVEEERGSCCGNINLGAALAHVVADTTRTFSELTAAFVIQVFETDSVRTDAVAAIVINITILLSGLYVCFEVAVRARVLWRRRYYQNCSDQAVSKGLVVACTTTADD